MKQPKFKEGKPKRIAWTRNNTNAATFDRTVNAFREAGLDDILIAGIIGNFIKEKGYNFDAKDSANYHGLGQINTKDWNTIGTVYGGYDEDALIKYYLDHALGRVDKKYAGSLGYKQGSMTRKYATPEEAAVGWERSFERPVIVKNGKVVGYQGEEDRKAFARDVYNYLCQQRLNQQVQESQTQVPDVVRTERPIVVADNDNNFVRFTSKMDAQRDTKQAMQNIQLFTEWNPSSNFKLRLLVPTLDQAVLRVGNINMFQPVWRVQ